MTLETRVASLERTVLSSAQANMHMAGRLNSAVLMIQLLIRSLAEHRPEIARQIEQQMAPLEAKLLNLDLPDAVVLKQID